MRIKLLLLILLWTATAGAADLLEPEVAFALSARALDHKTIEARFKIAPGYYLYRDKIKWEVFPAEVKIATEQLPKGKMKEDQFFGRMEVYRGQVKAKLTLDRPVVDSTVTIKAQLQGCADVGVCYVPFEQLLVVTMPESAKRSEVPFPVHLASAGLLSDLHGVTLLAEGKRIGEVSFERIDSDAELRSMLKKAKRPVLLDFYADWCAPCKQMEKETFSDSRVAAKLRDFLLLQVDMTRLTDQHRALLQRFKLVGPPGIIFFDSRGEEIKGARVLGFQPPAKFLATLNAVKS